MKYIKYILIGLFFVSLGLACNIQEKKSTATSPWGVAAHPLWEKEWTNLDQSLGYVESAGITWLREDFGFARVCRKKGEFYFDQFDYLLDKADEYSIQIHPILQAYDNELKDSGRVDVMQIYNHPEEWRMYVRETVKRYHTRLKTWEIWNEQDGGFWKPAPNAEQYVNLLKIAYEEIKTIDKEALVVAGGLCHWNTDYLQAMYNAGAKGYFDVLAVHPYHNGPDSNPKAKRTMQEFYALMEKNGDKDLPVWITEFGGTSFESQLMQQAPDFMLKAIEYSLHKIGNTQDISEIKIGLAASPRVEFLNELETTRNWLPNIKLEIIPFDKLQALDPKEVPVLIGGEGIQIDEPLLKPLFEYVKRGGLVIGHDKVPFHTVMYQDKNGTWQQEDRPSIYNDWGMHFDAWWKIAGIPESSREVRTSKEVLNNGLSSVSDVYVDRFLTNKQAKDGDKYYSIVESYHNGKHIGDGMALYTYQGGGGILNSTIRLVSGYTEKEQANLLQRNYLCYLSLGVEKLFWYDLHSDGPMKGEREHNFGLLNNNWTAKPSYFAYNEMTRYLGMYPEFIERLVGENLSVWALVFQRKEDDSKVLAVWSIDKETSIELVDSNKARKLLVLKDSDVNFIPLNFIKKVNF